MNKTAAGAKKAMSKSEIAAALAEKVGLSKKQVNQFFDEQAKLASQQAKNAFVIPGIGKLVVVKRSARKMIMRFGPKAGQEIMVPEKRAVKFRVAKALKEAVLK